MSHASVLIVEDERIFALDLKSRLERNNFQVIGSCSNGKDALSIVKTRQPSLVLMDINIEGDEDGIVTAEKIHDSTRTPVIFLTAYTEDSLIQRARKTLPFGYLVKPCDTRELIATINMALARHASEMQVEAECERYQLALQAAELSVWEWQTDKLQQTANGPVELIFGEQGDYFNEPVEQFIRRFTNGDQRQISKTLENDQPVTGHFKYLRRDQTIGWLEIHAKYLHKDTPDQRIIGVAKDITERRNMEIRLKQASMIFESTMEGVAITDMDLNIISVNPAFSAITRYDKDSVLHQHIDSVLHIQRHSKQFYQQLIASGETAWSGEITCRRSDNSHFVAWEQVHLLREPGGEPGHFLFCFFDISALREVDERLSYLAHHDSLTGLPNRQLFIDRLDHELFRNQRNQSRFALAFIDLDNFKTVNDTLGHDAGDQLLKIISQRLRDYLRRSDTLARLGGDEFVVIMGDTDSVHDISMLAEKWIEHITAPCVIAGQSVAVSASIGIACYPDDARDSSSLLKAADSAMYHAKEKGRNTYAFFDKKMAEQVAYRLHIEQGLKRALQSEDQLRLLYQPVYHLASLQIVGAEALLRWQHPELGSIKPDDFIAIAEESSLISQLGEWVINECCRQIAEWRSQGTNVPLIAINISSRQLLLNGLHDILAKALKTHHVSAECIELELTERAMHIMEQSAQSLYELRKLGVSISVDDFGTGYSSLSLLKNLPLDKLKLDKSFTMDLLDNPSSEAIARCIIAISQALRFDVIAEGIESTGQLDWLRRFNCQYGQGYLLSKPVSATQLALLINSKKKPLKE